MNRIIMAAAVMAVMSSTAFAQSNIASPFSPIDSVNSNNQSPVQSNVVDNSLGISSASANGNTSTNTNINPSNATVGPVTNTNGIATNNAANTVNGNTNNAKIGDTTVTTGAATTTSGAATTNAGNIGSTIGSGNLTQTNSGNVSNNGGNNVNAADQSNTNSVNNRDVNNNANLQGQRQSANNTQSQSTSSSATGGSVGDTTSTARVDGSGNSQVDVAGNNADQQTEVNVDASDRSSVVYEAQKRNPVSSAYAAPLSIGSGVCMYTPVSASGQFVTFGFSGSGARRDDECERRSTADMFARVGMTYEACLIMAQAPHAKAAGIVCERPQVVAPAAPAAPAPVFVPRQMAPIPNPVPVYDGERG